ncbi:unnamed protein product [Polarella glacialis]|uniref:Uncharacterized protein n=1 Tax=Polarella glacialis TaxID=89957 RepID=A0A813JAI6_POLGL|nr:unnamed protein product [Polarella glacialis]
MYLITVLQTIADDSREYQAEDLYKLNEAIFNLPEEDTIDVETTEKLFKALNKLKKAVAAGKCDSDPNFYYDYVGLLSTMQNQHFFSAKQTKTILEWLNEAIKAAPGAGASQESAKGGSKSSASTAKDLARLEADNAKMLKEIEQLRELSSAIQTIQAFKMPKGFGGGGGGGGKGGDSHAAATEGGEQTSKSKRRRGRGGGGGGGSGA